MRASVPSAALRVCAVSLIAAACLAEGDALASPPFELAGGLGGQGGFNGRTVEGGASSSYYNPALLVDATPGLSLGVLVLGEQIGITLAGRPGTQYAVPEGIENATHANGSQWASAPIPTNWLQNGRAATTLNPALPARPRQGDGSGSGVFAYQMLGLVTKLFHDRLALGAYALIPYSKFTGRGRLLQRRARAVLHQQLAPRALRRSPGRHVDRLRGRGQDQRCALGRSRIHPQPDDRGVHADVRREHGAAAEHPRRLRREGRRRAVPARGRLVQARRRACA